MQSGNRLIHGNKMDLNYTVAILNMTIFLFLLEGMVIYNKEKIKNSFMFLLFSLLFIYIIDMLALVFINIYFKWYKDLMVLFLNQTLIYVLMSLIYVIYYMLLKFKMKKSENEKYIWCIEKVIQKNSYKEIFIFLLIIFYKKFMQNPQK